jgi:hypothetical protein
MKKFPISLVIPSNESNFNLNNFFSFFFKWRNFPSEIILVNTKKKIELDSYILSFLKKRKIELKILNKFGAYPGHARNIAIKFSNFKILAFLDTTIITSDKWLQYGYYKITKDKYDLVFGKTLYLVSTNKDKIILASTYGFNPISTLPGSILNKKIFDLTGVFIENIRAGEDAEWIYRLGMHKIRKCVNREIVYYKNLQGKSYIFFVKKWFRNYSYSKKLSYLNNSKEVYYLVLSVSLFILSFSWNSVISNWSMNDPFYVPHVTKITVLIVFLIYFFYRVVFVPFKKGVGFRFILRNAIPTILIFSLFLDIVKCLAFVASKFKK